MWLSRKKNFFWVFDLNRVKGAGGSSAQDCQNWFLVFVVEGSHSYLGVFTGSKISILAWVITFSKSENTYNYIARENLNR